MLEVRALHAGYKSAGVLRGVELRVAASEVVALLGRNGMGKTTLIRSICGLTPPAVSEGTIQLDGTSIVGRPSYDIARRGIGLVPQGRRIFRSLTVEENLAIVARDGNWNAAAIYELFPRLGERRSHRGATLSGGEQQMLAIARALMTNPRLVVMDEPSEGLAPAVLDLILDRLGALKQTGIGLLIAEQNVDLALALADRVAILGEAGSIAWTGRPEDLRAKPAVLAELVGIRAPSAIPSNQETP